MQKNLSKELFEKKISSSLHTVLQIGWNNVAFLLKILPLTYMAYEEEARSAEQFWVVFFQSLHEQGRRYIAYRLDDKDEALDPDPSHIL